MSIRPMFRNRDTQGDSILVRELRNDHEYHHRYFRMSKDDFDEILNKITPTITGARTHCRPIPPMDKLAIAIRFLASGNSQMSLAMSYRVSPSKVGNILREVFGAIVSTMKHEFLPTPTPTIWKKNEEGFFSKWNHPNAIGAMDGKHIKIQAPKLSGSTNHNYKGYFSVVLLAIVGPNYKFTAVDIGASGSQSDGGVFSRSKLCKWIEDGRMGIPEPKLVGSSMLPHVIVSDDAFALKSNIMKPFPGKFLTKEKRIYNYRMSRARMVVENSFGILAARWRIFHTSIVADKSLVDQIVEVAVILHNYLITKNDVSITPDTEVDGEIAPGSWRLETPITSTMSGIRHQGSNNHSSNAAKIRDGFMDYFNSEEGSVCWQNKMV